MAKLDVKDCRTLTAEIRRLETALAAARSAAEETFGKSSAVTRRLGAALGSVNADLLATIIRDKLVRLVGEEAADMLLASGEKEAKQDA